MPSGSSPKPLVLVDGSSYLFRAYHALPPLTTSAGEPTGAIYGVASMLNRLVNDYAPTRMAVVFDAPGKTFRSEIYADYKANRPPMPDDLGSQTAPLKELIEALGLPLVCIEGVEADDVIATLADHECARGGQVVVSTGDKDLAQLVDGGITLVNTMSGETLDAERVYQKFGVPPERIIDYLALVGDTTDNIPGVPKCGPKTAAKWLAQYGSLDGVIAHADDIGGKIGENLRGALDDVRRARELVTIRRDVALGIEPEHLDIRAPDTAKLRAIYTRLEFRGLLDQLGAEAEPAEAPDAANGASEVAARCEYETILEHAQLDAWIERLRTAECFALDAETTSLDANDCELVGLSFAIEPEVAVYVPVGHRYAGAPEQLDLEEVLERLRPVLEDPDRPKLGQNLKYDLTVLAHHGVTLRGVRHDTMLQSYALDATATRHDMDSLAQKYLGVEATPFKRVCGSGRNQITFDQVALEDATPYAAEDAEIALRLHHELWPRLQLLSGPLAIYEQIEMPLVPVLARMERTGVRVDADALAAQSRALAERLADLEARAHAEAGGPFNLNSPKQLQEILFDRLQLPSIRNTPSGQPSTAEDVLEVLAADYALPALILEYRGLAKLKSTYSDALPQRINPRTGRVHTCYQQAVASTGRLSSSEPNLQNIPIRTEEGRRIREAFVAPSGYRLLAADYSQIELRIMAHLSGDEGLLAAFADDRDIHRATAAEVFGQTLDTVTDDQRRAAKAINFGLIYGMSAWGLGRQLGIGRAEAQAYVDRYFERYPGVRAYMDATRERARAQGYVETAFGRRLYVPEIRARNAQRRQYAERTAINAPMQGTAADIIKRAMIAVDAWLQDADIDARLIMQVHDELILEVADNAIDAVRTHVRKMMAAAAELSVPLLVETGVGHNWAEAH